VKTEGRGRDRRKSKDRVASIRKKKDDKYNEKTLNVVSYTFNFNIRLICEQTLSLSSNK
jgi:hypothetical protein